MRCLNNFLPSISVTYSKPTSRSRQASSSVAATLTLYSLEVALNALYNGLKQLSEELNEKPRYRFRAPASLIKKEDLSVKENLQKLDESYQNLYVKPVIFKTLQLGYDLSFKKRYQLGAGAITVGIYTAVVLLTSTFHILILDFPTFWMPAATPEIATTWMIYAFFASATSWFLHGMLAWSLFLVFNIALQISAQPVEFRPYEPLKALFAPVTKLVLKTSSALALVVAWFSPYALFIGIIPPAPALAILIPVIILSLLLPFFGIHKGMNRSRARALCLKQIKLEELKKKPLKSFDKNLKVQTHLMDDYESILENSEWALTASQILEAFGTILLPIITFFLSRLT